MDAERGVPVALPLPVRIAGRASPGVSDDAAAGTAPGAAATCIHALAVGHCTSAGAATSLVLSLLSLPLESPPGNMHASTCAFPVSESVGVAAPPAGVPPEAELLPSISEVARLHVSASEIEPAALSVYTATESGRSGAFTASA